MNIGEAAHASGVSAKKIRYYESIGLIQTVKRRSSGYRQYEPADVHRLRFIKTARDVGLSFLEIREFLALWTDRKRSNGEVKKVALAKVAELERRLADIGGMIVTLQQLAKSAKHRPDGLPRLDDTAERLKPQNHLAGTRRKKRAEP